jgi:hypothetical protein
MWDFGHWTDSDVNSDKRNEWYPMLVDYHSSAIAGKNKNGGTAMGKAKTAADSYKLSYRNASHKHHGETYGPTDKHYWMYSYLDSKDRVNDPLKKQLDLLHNWYASGDMDEMDFWDNYLGWNNKYANSNITTPVGEDQMDASSDAYYDEATGTTVVNTYNVTRGEDKATESRLKAILANTYNVRSESMEALLEAILEELKRRKDGNPGPTNTSGSSKLFDERIPSQVTKLSVG